MRAAWAIVAGLVLMGMAVPATALPPTLDRCVLVFAAAPTCTFTSGGGPRIQILFLGALGSHEVSLYAGSTLLLTCGVSGLISLTTQCYTPVPLPVGTVLRCEGTGSDPGAAECGTPVPL
jgi:hypothetical protein